jgi:dTDP-L-rhamnose 4-epimerase
VSGKNILITGGAGFIGSHLADELIALGHRVRALDVLSHQVHGESGARPDYLNPDVELIRGDIRDASAVGRALNGMEVVFHLAASVGVGQSMYQIADYVGANELGTAVLLQALTHRPVERLIVASSMSIYGEGLYRDSAGATYDTAERTISQLRCGDWEPRNPAGEALQPLPTPESKRPNLASIYALSKYVQERACLLVGGAYNIPTIALRFFNVYGPRQALANPYTGVLAIFASRLLNGNSPLIFEDGNQQRDFVAVQDVVQACRLALEAPSLAVPALNIGSGAPHTVSHVAGLLAETLGKEHIVPQLTAKYRVGDIRHCFADISLARSSLGYTPRVSLRQGLLDLARDLEGQAVADRVLEASAELEERGLTV